MVNAHQSYIENWNLTVCVKKETSKQTKQRSPVLPACSVLICMLIRIILENLITCVPSWYVCQYASLFKCSGKSKQYRVMNKGIRKIKECTVIFHRQFVVLLIKHRKTCPCNKIFDFGLTSLLFLFSNVASFVNLLQVCYIHSV